MNAPTPFPYSFAICARLLLALLICGYSSDPVDAQQPATQSVKDVLLEQGLLIGNTARKLAAPSLTPNQSEPERDASLKKLAGRLGWEKFARDSVFAPVTINLSYLKSEDGQRIGHDIQTAFIAHASLANLRDDQFLKAVFGTEGKGKDQGFQVKDMPDSVLTALGIEPRSDEGQKFASVILPLLNRVELQGTIRVQKYEGDNWIEFYWQIDPRFTEHSDKLEEPYRNAWIKLDRDERGAPIKGTPKAYRGCGGFLSVWKVGSEDLLLIESRMLMYEPKDWFAGSNFLRSKLPPALQENARSFRRQLASEK